jgi:MFS family permease
VHALSDVELARVVRRNTIILSASTTVTSGTLQLVAALASTTFVLATGITGLLGLGPAIFLGTSALTAFPAGRAMDRFGRIPIIAIGFLVGAIGGVVTGFSVGAENGFGVVAGFAMIGAANNTVQLARAAGGEMYPPERRARGISLVLFGAVFGAILGPAVFSPLFAGKELDADSLVTPWIVAGGLMLIGLALVVWVRPDPKKIAERYATPGAPTVTAAPLREIVGRPGVPSALLAAITSFAVMVSVMNLTGYAVIHEHHHTQQDVFPIIGAHVFGMFALVLVVGRIVERFGGTRTLVAGLAVEAISCAGLVWAETVLAHALLLFGLGLGWNLAFVAATTTLVNRAAPSERGKLVGFSDLMSGLTGAALALIGGYALEAVGVVALGVGAAALAVLPAIWIAGRAAAAPPAAPAET